MPSIAMSSGVFAHEVSGGTGAATISTLTAVAMGIVLLLLVVLVFARRANGDDADARDEASRG
jgi:hypothetical protein